MKETILFDIDYTLINTANFKQNFKSKISELLGVSLDDFLKIEQGYVKKGEGFTDFIPQEYISFLSRSFDFNESEISKAFFDDSNFENIFFEDVLECLDNLKRSFDLGIFSEGFNEFQMLKLHKTGILKYFDQNLIFIFNRKLVDDSLKLLPDGCFIIDDNLSVICALEETKRFRPIWLNRKISEGTDDCAQIFDLKNIADVLKDYRENK